MCIEKQVEIAMTAVKQNFNKLDVVVNSAGIMLNLNLHTEDYQGKAMENVQAMFDVSYKQRRQCIY